jgi:lysozyme
MNDSLHISQAGLDFIKGFEGLRLTAYYDAVHVITIGYGHTNLDGEAPKVVPGLKITKEQAEEILRRSLADRYEVSVKKLVKVPLTQGQFDALVSFCYNCGEGNLKRLIRNLNSGNYASVANRLPLYDRAGGKVLKGLERRRAGEVAMWNRHDATVTKIVELHKADPAPVASSIDAPDEVPDKIAKWGAAAASVAAPLSYMGGIDWKVLAVLCATAVIGGIAYMIWRYKTKPAN